MQIRKVFLASGPKIKPPHFAKGLPALSLVLCVMLFGGCDFSGQAGSISEPLKLGYCPTMEPLAERIAATNAHIVLDKKSSAADALQALQLGELHMALVGRLAKAEEKGQAQERVLGGGYTLVGDSKRFIQHSELSSMAIHTWISPELAQALLPDSIIIPLDSPEPPEGRTLLISWADFSDEHELVVVMNEGKKAEEFRIPVLYSHNPKNLNILVLGERNLKKIK
jgi:hypothetical protein